MLVIYPSCCQLVFNRGPMFLAELLNVTQKADKWERATDSHVHHVPNVSKIHMKCLKFDTFGGTWSCMGGPKNPPNFMRIGMDVIGKPTVAPIWANWEARSPRSSFPWVCVWFIFLCGGETFEYILTLPLEVWYGTMKEETYSVM